HHATLVRYRGGPVELVGQGEGPDDVAPVEPEAFVDALRAYAVARVRVLTRSRRPPSPFRREGGLRGVGIPEGTVLSSHRVVRRRAVSGQADRRRGSCHRGTVG